MVKILTFVLVIVWSHDNVEYRYFDLPPAQEPVCDSFIRSDVLRQWREVLVDTGQALQVEGYCKYHEYEGI